MKHIILGASPNPDRAAYQAAVKLEHAGLDWLPISNKKGTILNKEMYLIQDKPLFDKVHTLLLYINPKRQLEYTDYILSLKPKRIIFNPGTENPHLQKLASDQGIETLFTCSLVMLSLGSY